MEKLTKEQLKAYNDIKEFRKEGIMEDVMGIYIGFITMLFGGVVTPVAFEQNTYLGVVCVGVTVFSGVAAYGCLKEGNRYLKKASELEKKLENGNKISNI